MPSIELVAVDQLKPIDLSSFSFAVQADPQRRSHRSPHPRFQSDFDNVSGILYHLGNPGLKANPNDDRCFFAYDLLSEASKKVEAEFLEFASEHRAGVESLLNLLIADSPKQQLILTSDWQFGPEWTKHHSPVSLNEFWRLHDARGVLLNVLYPIHGHTA